MRPTAVKRAPNGTRSWFPLGAVDGVTDRISLPAYVGYASDPALRNQRQPSQDRLTRRIRKRGAQRETAAPSCPARSFLPGWADLTRKEPAAPAQPPKPCQKAPKRYRKASERCRKPP